MSRLRRLCVPAALAAVLVLGRAAPARLLQAPAKAPGDREPVLRLEPGGPSSFVTALAFRADGKALYVAGWDKVVRVWAFDEATRQFVPDRLRPAYRVPIG